MPLQCSQPCQYCNAPRHPEHTRYCSAACQQADSSYNVLLRMLGNIPNGDACLEWPRARACKYGAIWDGRRTQYAHRLAYEITHGAIPKGLCVLHRCDNPPCFRPSHLFLGTDGDNVRDCIAKGRMRRCPALGERASGAKMTEAKVIEIRKLAADGIRQVALAKQFGIRQCTISQIIRRDSWKHI